MRAAFLIAMLLAAAPALAQPLRSEIQGQDDKFAQAFNSGNAAALAQLYTQQASVLPPGAPMASGRAAIQQFWEGAIRNGLKNLSLEVISVERYGNAAREIGHFGLDAPGQAGQTSRVEGKYVVIWKRAGGNWQLETDIWNVGR